MIIVKLISFVFCFVATVCFSVDLIQIDVGNDIKFTGPLFMDSTEYVNNTNHGTHMALALNDELKKQKSKPVYAKQLAWKYLENSRSALLNLFIEALNEGPKVLSLSFGGKDYDYLEDALLQTLAINDVVIVAAAGNDGGGRRYYPANYRNKCIISVGTTILGKKAKYSNDAQVWLEYNELDPHGTSASTARMAGIILQIRRANPKFSCEDTVVFARTLYGKIKK